MYLTLNTVHSVNALCQSNILIEMNESAAPSAVAIIKCTVNTLHTHNSMLSNTSLDVFTSMPFFSQRSVIIAAKW